MKGVTWGKQVLAAAFAALLVTPAAFATNGYFKIGTGSKNRGMAGAGVAFPQDSSAVATNPAGLSWISRRTDAGVEVFSPIRGSEGDGRLDATGVGGASTDAESGADTFVIPHFGYAHGNRSRISFGFAMAAVGGMNTRYDNNVYTDAFAPAIGNTSTAPGGGVPPSGFAGGLEAMGVPTSSIDPVLAAFGSDPDLNPAAGVNLAQVIMSPTISYKINEDHAVGASLLVGFQSFRAYGLGLFKGLSTDPGNLTDRGNDKVWGTGIRLGWNGKVTDRLTLGVAGSSKIYMQEFDDYAGLFAEQGDFDIPANYTVGLAFRATPKLTIAVDVQRILYGDVKSINNPGPTADEFISAFANVLSGGTLAGTGVSNPLGSDDGWGFGWDDITVVKVGVNYMYNKKWTLRAGVNHGDNPIDDDQNLFNILAPGIVTTHLTAGFTYTPNKNHEITVGYMYALDQTQKHTYSTEFPGFGPLSYEAKIGMFQNSLEAAYAWKF